MSPATRKPRTHVQAWIELLADDPAARSALEVARQRLAAGARLAGLRRLRLVELAGVLPARATIEALLHRSTRFYNPHKERCTLRAAADDAPPIRAGEHTVLVVERGDERRAPAERWWRHETGRSVQVREGVVWVLRFDAAAGTAGAADAASLAVLRDPQHGLFCNPHSQESKLAADRVPLPWLAKVPRRRASPDRTEVSS